MSFTSHPVKAATSAWAIAFVTAAVWVLRGYLWPTLSNVEVAPLQAALDPTLFRHDFVVQEALRFSPRFYYNELILLPARLGLPLAWSFALWHLAVLAALVGAVRAAADTLRLVAVTSALLLVWLLVVNVGCMGDVYFYTHAPVPAVWAGAVAAWGGVFALRRQAIAAFGCFGAAALLQFLVGFYTGLLALPLLWSASNRVRALALTAWGSGLALVYVPLAISGRADTTALTPEAFVEIYARLRHPHHLLPSSWPWPQWQRAGLFWLGAWYFLHRTSFNRPAVERIVLYATLALTAMALTINYVFVEIFPSVLIAKLQPARITPLAQAVLLVLLATRFDTVLARRQWLHAAALGLAPFALFPGLLLLLAAVLTPALLEKPTVRWPLWLLLAATLVAFRPFGGSLGYHVARHGLWLSLWAVALIPALLSSRPALLIGCASLTIGVAGFVATTPDFLPPPLAGRFALDAAPSDPPGRLGARFRARSSPDALVLVPPTSDAWSFKLYAQRAVVVDDKNIAFTTSGLREWHDRMQRVLGTPFVPGLDPTAAWRGQSPAALAALAAHYGAHYVLTQDSCHDSLPGRRLDRDGGWSLWELAASP
ncbi:MAG: hypothetical protein NTV51_07220 [Verrucomicrobia bacterium]|nr:hypothetical protein [Verrucomicrobiota bacterium]